MKTVKTIAIVGAGFSGAVLANKLARAGYDSVVFDSRSHVAGNCYTERDPETNIMLHVYGPHIFHTDNREVWDFVCQFSDLIPYINRVKTTAVNQVFSMPINLHTINQFFNKTLSPVEAKSLVVSIAENRIICPKTFEEQALKFVGKDLYETFLKGYTLKQWGIDPKKLPASILKRLPVRFNYDDNYYNHKYQGIPKEGYTEIVEKLLDDRNIKLKLNTTFLREYASSFDHVFYTGPIDLWFSHEKGRLGYRTLDLIKETYEGDYQGCAVMNYADLDVPYTRITEHKYFSPWETYEKTVIFKEYSRACGADDIPYYPVRFAHEKKILRNYISLAKQSHCVSFLGRLGTYRYLDMDATIAEALSASKVIIDALANNKNIPVFFLDPV